MKKISLWNAFNSDIRHYPTLRGKQVADVVIIGGGITGISMAQALAYESLSVVVLEARTIGSGTTSHSTGNIYQIDKYITEILSKHDREAAEKITLARTEALRLVRENIGALDIDCDAVTVPWIAYAANDAQKSGVRKKYEFMFEYGLPVSLNAEIPYKSELTVRLEDQLQLNPARYLQGLARSISCNIYEFSPVVKIETQEQDHVVYTSGGAVICKHVVHATHTPKGILLAHTELGPYREYGIAVKIAEDHPPGIFWGHFEDDLLISTRTYTRKEETFLVVVGHPHKVGQGDSEDMVKKLMAFASDHFTVKEFTYQWGGQHYRPADLLPYIGPTTSDSTNYIATGFATDGLVWGTAAAQVLKASILHREHPLKDLVSPSRFTPAASAARFLKENFNNAEQYLKNLVSIGVGSTVEQVLAGEGKIIKLDGHKAAVHKEENGTLHACEAHCTHMQALVVWNNLEKSWDCPVHGSRFSKEGSVLEGPALRALESIDLLLKREDAPRSGESLSG